MTHWPIVCSGVRHTFRRCAWNLSCLVFMSLPPKNLQCGGILYSDASVREWVCEWVCASRKPCERHILKTRKGISPILVTDVFGSLRCWLDFGVKMSQVKSHVTAGGGNNRRRQPVELRLVILMFNTESPSIHWITDDEPNFTRLSWRQMSLITTEVSHLDEMQNYDRYARRNDQKRKSGGLWMWQSNLRNLLQYPPFTIYQWWANPNHD